MAITIDWSTKVISVPRADMSLIQLTPTEIRELNLNWFRLQLKDIEDGDEGMVNDDTHSHNTEVSLGGLTYARVIAIINGYTVTFEDGQYAVNLVGANSNVGDVVNVNQVSVRSSNSAGMTSSPDIEYSSFAGAIHLDEVNGVSGTVYPRGTPRMPVNNLTDAMLIATYRGFGTIHVIGDATIDAGGDYSGMTFIGESHEKSTLTVDADANVTRCEFYNAKIEGTLDGESLLVDCLIEDLIYVNGEVKECFLQPPGTITLGGGAAATFARCVTECTEWGDPFTISYGGSGQSLAIRDLSGAIKLANKSGPEDSSVVMAGGAVYLDLTTLTAGRIRITGVCDVYDWATKERMRSGTYGGLTLVVNAISNTEVADSVWDHNDAATALASINDLVGIEMGRWRIDGTQMIFYDEDNVTEVARFDLLDGSGDPTSDPGAARERVRV